MTNVLTQEFVFSLLNDQLDGKEFSIKLEEVWQRAGFSLYENAVRAVKNYLVENEDYVIDTSLRTELTTMQFSSIQEKAAFLNKKPIKLSADGFDHLMMQAQTVEGREARKLFIVYKKQYMNNLKFRLRESSPETYANLCKEHQALFRENQNLRMQLEEVENDSEYLALTRHENIDLEEALSKTKKKHEASELMIAALIQVIKDSNPHLVTSGYLPILFIMLDVLANKNPQALEYFMSNHLQMSDQAIYVFAGDNGIFEYMKENYPHWDKVKKSKFYQSWLAYKQAKEESKELKPQVNPVLGFTPANKTTNRKKPK